MIIAQQIAIISCLLVAKEQLIESLQIQHKVILEFVLSNTIHYASSGSFAIEYIFLKKISKSDGILSKMAEFI